MSSCQTLGPGVHGTCTGHKERVLPNPVKPNSERLELAPDAIFLTLQMFTTMKVQRKHDHEGSNKTCMVIHCNGGKSKVPEMTDAILAYQWALRTFSCQQLLQKSIAGRRNEEPSALFESHLALRRLPALCKPLRQAPVQDLRYSC